MYSKYFIINICFNTIALDPPCDSKQTQARIQHQNGSEATSSSSLRGESSKFLDREEMISSEQQPLEVNKGLDLTSGNIKLVPFKPTLRKAWPSWRRRESQKKDRVHVAGLPRSSKTPVINISVCHQFKDTWEVHGRPLEKKHPLMHDYCEIPEQLSYDQEKVGKRLFSCGHLKTKEELRREYQHRRPPCSPPSGDLHQPLVLRHPHMHHAKYNIQQEHGHHFLNKKRGTLNSPRSPSSTVDSYYQPLLPSTRATSDLYLNVQEWNRQDKQAVAQTKNVKCSQSKQSNANISPFYYVNVLELPERNSHREGHMNCENTGTTFSMKQAHTKHKHRNTTCLCLPNDHQMSLQRRKSENVGMCVGGDSNSNCRAVTHSGTTVNVEVELEPETELNEDAVRLSETKQETKNYVSTSKEDCRDDKHSHVMIEGNGISAVSSNEDQVVQKSANGDEVESQAIDICAEESRQTVFNRDGECIQKQISLESNSTSPIATASAMCSALQKDQTDEVINDISSTTTIITPHKFKPGKAISVRATEKVNEKKEPELSYECQPHAMPSKNLAIVTHGAEKWLEGTVQTVENVHFLDSSNFSSGKSTAPLPTTNSVSSTPRTGGLSLDSSSTAAMKFTPYKPTLRDAVPLKVVKPNSTANDGDDLQVTGSKSKKSKQKSGLKMFTRSTTRQTAVDKATTPSCQPVITKDGESSTSSERSCHTSNHDDIPVPVAHSSLPARTLQEDHIYEMIPGSIIESGIRLTPYQRMLRIAASVRPKKTEVSSKTQKQPTVISMSRSQDQIQPWRKTFKTKEELRKQYKCRKLSGKLQIVHQPLQNPYHESVNECGTSDTIHEQDLVHSEHGSQNDDSDFGTPYHPYQPIVFTHEAVNSESYQNVIIKPYLTKTAADRGHLDENEDGVNTSESQQTAKILEESDNGLRPSMYTDQDTVLHESSTDSTENQSISKSSIEEGYPNTSELAIEETQMVSHDPAVESSQYGAGECTPSKRFDGECVKKSSEHYVNLSLSTEKKCTILAQNSERNEEFEACDEMEFEDLLTNSTDQPSTNKCKYENVSIPSTDRKIEHHPAPYLNMTILLPPKTRANQGQLDQDEDTGPRDCSEFKQDVQKFPKCEERTHSHSTDHDSELKELGISFTEDDSVGRSSIQCHDECLCMPEEPFQVYQLHENSHRPDFKSSDLCGTGKDLPTTVQGSHEKKSSSLYVNLSLRNAPDKEKESHLRDLDVLKNPGKEEEEEVHSEKEFHLLSERDRQSAKGLKYENVSISSADEQQNTVKKDLPYEFKATLSEEFVCDLGDPNNHNTEQNTQVNVSKCAKVQTRDVVQHRIMNEYSVDS